MKINQIIINELSESAQPGVATTAAQTPQAQAAAQAIQKGLAVLQQQLPNFDASFNTTDAIQEIMPDGTVVMDSNLQPSALQNVRKILALGGGANFKVTMSTQTIPSATGQQVALQAKPGVAEGDRPFRGVDGARYRDNDEQHDLDPTDWYIVKDGEMFLASIYPNDVQQAIAQGFSRTEAEAEAEAEAKLRDNSQGVAEGSLNELSSDLLKRSAQAATDKRNQAMDPELHNALGGGYMNPLATHYDNVSQKMDNRAAQVRKKETIQKIASKIASPAVMRKIGMAEQGVAESQHSCPHCGGEMVSEELMNEKKDACYYKVKSRYKVWPSAYASGALVKCRKSGADSWGNGGKKNEGVVEAQLDEKWTKKYKDSINCSNPKGFSQKAHCAGKQKNESAIMSGLNQLDEGWKEKLGAAALAGSMALGSAGANARVTPDGQGGFTGGLKPTSTVTAPADSKPAAESPRGFSKEYLQKAANPNRTGRYMISVEKAQELLKSMP